MPNKDFSKTIASSYHSTIIPICRLLKSHATNIMLLPDNVILMQPVMNTIRNYMIVNASVDYSRFIYTYFSIPEVSKINTKFKKTKSEIDWTLKDNVNYLMITNDNMDPYETPIINNPETIADTLNATYKNIPGWSGNNFKDLIGDEDSSMYIQLPQSLIDDMVNKKLCEIDINGHSILLAKPFLGDLKNTTYLGYRLVYEDEFKFTLKFKQSEELGNIYTYASFLNV